MRKLVVRGVAAAVAITGLTGGIASAAPAPAPPQPAVYLVPGLNLGPLLGPTTTAPQLLVGALLPLFPPS